MNEMKRNEEIKFWQKAKKIIEKGYGKGHTTQYDLDCVQCMAQLARAWINKHIDLLRWDIKKNNK